VKVLIRTAARADILRQYAYYLDEKDAPAAAQRFLDAVESAIDALCRMPGMGAPRQFVNPRLAGLRSWHLSGFPAMRIYYIHSGDVIRIVRILHGKRDVRLLFESDSGDDEEEA
jgi:plasmid stabilization system protein ParE